MKEGAREGGPEERLESRSSARTARRGLRIDAIASGFVGALALAVSTYNVYLQREQIRAQVWPNLEWTYSESYTAGDSHFDWNIENSGVGPALVKEVRMTVEGKPAKSWKEATDLLEAIDPDFARMSHANPNLGRFHEGLSGRVLGAGLERHPLRLVGVKSEDQETFQHAFAKLKVEICYCSTLHECWIYPGQRPVSACAMEGVAFTD